MTTESHQARSLGRARLPTCNLEANTVKQSWALSKAQRLWQSDAGRRCADCKTLLQPDVAYSRDTNIYSPVVVEGRLQKRALEGGCRGVLGFRNLHAATVLPPPALLCHGPRQQSSSRGCTLTANRDLLTLRSSALLHVGRSCKEHGKSAEPVARG